QGDEKHHAFISSVRREKGCHVIVKERQSRGPKALRIGCQIHTAAQYSPFQLRHPIAPIAEALEERQYVTETEDRHAGIGSQLLSERQFASLPTKIAGTE